MTTRMIEALEQLGKSKTSVGDVNANSVIMELIDLVLRGETALETDEVLDKRLVDELHKCGVQLTITGTKHSEGIGHDLNLYGQPIPCPTPTGWIYHLTYI